MLVTSRQGRKTDKPHPGNISKRHSGTISREQLLGVLSCFFLGHITEISRTQTRSNSGANWCLGIIRNRTLIANSLINACHQPSDIGRFVLLDVDTSCIPRDLEGLVRPGIPSLIDIDMVDGGFPGPYARKMVCELTPTEDVSMHIEADWDGNPDTMLTCVRYKGRRITKISPASADLQFLSSWIPPVAEPEASPLKMAIPVSPFDSLSEQNDKLLVVGDCYDVPILVQAQGQPRMRYVATAMYDSMATPWIASNSLREAFRVGTLYQESRKPHHRPMIIVGTQSKHIMAEAPINNAGEQKMCLIR